MNRDSSEVGRSNRRLGTRLGVVVVAMFGFGFALVPFYEKICEVTGLRNIAQADAPANTQVDTSRTLRIEFDTNVRNLPWQFKAKEPVVAVHPGALTQVMFEIVNATDRPLTGQAIPSYGPPQAAQYFKKLECFCFAEHVLKPGESKQWPVVFVVDRKLPKDVRTITLSYTFFEVGGKTPAEPSAALAAPAPTGKAAS